MKITLCVSVSDGGLPMLKILAESAAALASGNHEVQIDFTYNSETERDAILAANLPVKIGRHHYVERDTSKRFIKGSVTHSRCINALFSAVEEDIAVICDYDIAFVARNWDETLADLIVQRGICFFGSPYSSSVYDTIPLLSMGKMQIACMKYQLKPNAIFLAFAPERIKPMTDCLSDFAELYDGPEDLPVKFIATQRDSLRYGLPLRTFLHVDTGLRVAELIEDRRLAYEPLLRRAEAYEVLSSFPANASQDDYPSFCRPEEYHYNGRPFVAHFRKATHKEDHLVVQYTKHQFEQDIKRYIGTL